MIYLAFTLLWAAAARVSWAQWMAPFPVLLCTRPRARTARKGRLKTKFMVRQEAQLSKDSIVVLRRRARAARCPSLRQHADDITSAMQGSGACVVVGMALLDLEPERTSGFIYFFMSRYINHKYVFINTYVYTHIYIYM